MNELFAIVKLDGDSIFDYPSTSIDELATKMIALANEFRAELSDPIERKKMTFAEYWKGYTAVRIVPLTFEDVLTPTILPSTDDE